MSYGNKQQHATEQVQETIQLCFPPFKDQSCDNYQYLTDKCRNLG